MPVPYDELASPKEDRDQTNMNLTLSNLTSRHQKLTLDSIAGHLVLPQSCPDLEPAKGPVAPSLETPLRQALWATSLARPSACPLCTSLHPYVVVS